MDEDDGELEIDGEDDEEEEGEEDEEDVNFILLIIIRSCKLREVTLNMIFETNFHIVLYWKFL